MKIVAFAFFGLICFTPVLVAQPAAPTKVPAAQSRPGAVDAKAEAVSPPSPETSALDAELFYRLLVGELTAREGDAGAGYALILDAARKTNDAQLYQRATDLALQSRAGEAALQSAVAWKTAFPASRDANRYVLQILVALNRLAETLEPLKTGIAMVPVAEKNAIISAVPRVYARVSDKKLAASVVEQALATYVINPTTSASAWAAIGRVRLTANDTVGALSAAKKGQAADIAAPGPILVAIEAMGPKFADAEAMVKQYLASPKPLAEIRMGYARALIDDQRLADAAAQLKLVNIDEPEFAPAWLVLGSLQLQELQLAPAQNSFERYVALSVKGQEANDSDEPDRGLAQAYLSLAQIAEKRKDFAAAEVWISKIDNAEEMIQAQTRRASILANQGKLAEGRQLIQGLPEREPGDARLKLLAEAGLLRDRKEFKLTYELLAKAALAYPQDTDILYDQAMMAEKLGQLPEMERLLRQVIAAKPDAYNAYNALGYSLADRNMRLIEAKQLIEKALEYVPNDPFIRDSLGWVEYRLGNLAAASQILADAFKAKPDAEIAAHLGEVLWVQGQQAKAISIWREGMLINAENETLLETVKRFKAKL